MLHDVLLPIGRDAWIGQLVQARFLCAFRYEPTKGYDVQLEASA